MQEASKKKKYIKNTLRFAVAFTALYFIFKGQDPRELKNTFLSVNLFSLIMAILLYIISQVIFVFRWYVLLRVQAIKIKLFAAVKLHFLGLFYNNFLPSSVGGDFLRAWYVTKHTDKRLEAALSVFIDRIIGLSGLIILSIGCFSFVPQAAKEEFFSEISKIDLLTKIKDMKMILVFTAVILPACIITFLILPKGRRLFLKGLKQVKIKWLEIKIKLQNAFKLYWDKKYALFLALLLSFLTQGVFIVGLWLVGRSIGIQADAKFYFIFFPVSWLLGTLPISPGGGGVVEWSVTVMFTRLPQVEASQAIVLAICQRLIWVLSSLIGFIIHITGAHLPREFFIDYKRPIN